MIFNFLGSNYSSRFGWRFLLARKSKVAYGELRRFLAEKYVGEAHLYYRGRTALREAIRLSGASHTLISGFTCYVVEEAVKDAGSRPVFVDISRRTFHFTLAELKKAHKAQPKIGAVVVQNTFGIGDKIKPIAAYCQKAGLVLIEDLAHCPANRYADGPDFGQIGDLVVVSFGDLKQIDVVSGGALIVRNKVLFDKITTPKPLRGHWRLRALERWQPLINVFLRNCYRWPAFARIVHGLLRRLHLLRSAAGGELFRDVGLHPARAGLILEQWQHLEADKRRRQELTGIYSRILQDNNPLLRRQPLLRYPFLVESSERSRLLAAAADKGFYLKDHWYDSFVHPSRFSEQSVYKLGSCPQKEKITYQVINLPLHKSINRHQAEKLARLVANFKSPASS